jgi:hypothetical protein
VKRKAPHSNPCGYDALKVAAFLSRCLPQPDSNDNYFDVKKDYGAIQEGALLSRWLYLPEADYTYTNALLLK